MYLLLNLEGEEIHISKNRAIISKTGININPKLETNVKEENKYFKNLNEAVTEELAIRFQKNVLRNHLDFEEENKLIEEYIEQKKQDGKDIDIDEISAILKKTFYSVDKEEKIKLFPRRMSYKRERIILNTLIDKLYDKNQNQFENREEVFDLFVKSAFTGNIVSKGSWGKLIDETFGNGTLQKIAEKDYNLEKLKDIVESLN